MTTKDPIAIVGTGCRFPGQCDSPSKLWELLREPRDLLKEIPEDRFSVDAFYHPKNYHHGTSNVRHSYLLDDDLRRFDAQFFGIKPVEANSIDPQQRLLLETVYESLEAAGLSPNQLRGTDTAVYVGVMSADYTDMISRDINTFPTYFATGTARSILSNRLSHFFDWHGPSMTIDTACSSSLIAVHQAVQSLRAGESSVAVVAGSNLILGPEQYIAESKLQMLSPTGRSRMWDADADGYARGEGVAAVVLKRLSQALADGDHVECIIRETGVNQDGKTPGITMPSASAQAALIRSTYARAGLDLSQRSDRPQYFEAHGTGTPAGDPIEAEAISNAFFGPGSNFNPSKGEDPLYVGSIKTVIGHTEGTAGLAAIIKASLALQAGKVPPNRLLNRLNPKVAPFYGNLKILSTAEAWPRTTGDAVRRASVNSFGFGGANAHAILESFDSHSNKALPSRQTQSDTCFTPFVFSASSDSALGSNLQSYRDYIVEATTHSDIPYTLRDLSWTLSSRRTALEYRTVLPAVSGFEDLITQLDEIIESQGEFHQSTRSPPAGTKLRILGIFTGQGAQWARMGAELIEKSPEASRIIEKLDRSLASLPLDDRPPWSLRDQITASPEQSQINTASISQPICTAIQVMLVDLLTAAGVEFSTVVGHSSGEIGAAYAAGYLTAEDAIRVAYYRGLHLRGTPEKKGAMMAVGTSFEDLSELCELPAFEGRVCVAASNSQASVTLSGDADAVEEVKIVLDEEKKFARLLKVDRAYHSHHMAPYADPYIRSLQGCNIKPKPGSHCRWVSSVFVEDIANIPQNESLGGKYWTSNLVKPVMFAEALSKALDSKDDSYDLVMEVGPHPALKGPASQTIQNSLEGQSIPYTGTLSRGKDSIQAFSTALGYVWESLGEGAVNFAAFDAFVTGNQSPKPKLCKGLPTYQWDHNRVFWHESRASKAFRTSKDGHNELLGKQFFDGAPDQLRWRNVLKRREIDWLEGHQVQGQVVFPCAGYVSACIEAAMKLPGTNKQIDQGQGQQLVVQTVELEDFIVGQAVVFGDDQDSGIETLVTLTDIDWDRSETQDNSVAVAARFAFYSSPNNDASEMTSHASCRVRVRLAQDDADNTAKNSVLPGKSQGDDVGMAEVESDRFYDALGKLGFGYSGPFKALKELRRKLGIASGLIHNSSPLAPSPPLIVQPATLDAAIQSIMLAYCYPGDSMLRSIYLPTGIKRLIISPQRCLTFTGADADVHFDSNASINTSRGLSGDVSIYALDGSSKAIQLEGLQTKPLSNPTESSDLNIFTELVWEVEEPDSEAVIATTPAPELNADLLSSLERVTYYYLRSLETKFPRKERGNLNLEWYQERLFAYVDHCLAKVVRGANPYAKPEWSHDTEATILEIFNRYPDNIDLRLMRAVGENLPSVIRDKGTMLEYMIQDNMLNDFYVVAHGMPRYTKYLASMASQIGHRYPHMSVLEIGAGTGGATKSFLKELGDSFSTYTFTDISSGFFAKAEETFASYSSRMNFKVLDIEKDIEEQGFADGSFDLIIASLVLHATRNLADTLKNVRRLLKPGGYLLLLEITENEQMRFGLIFGGLPGWWLGYDDGRALSPCVGIDEWKHLLKRTGFSGIETVIPHHEALPVPLSIIASQAVDSRIDFLKKPLSSPTPALFSPSAPVIPRLTLIGGGGSKSAQLAEDISNILSQDDRHCGETRFIASLEDIRPDQDLPIGGTTLSLVDADEAVFKSMTAEKLRGFQEIFKQSANVLWITQGSRFGEPFARMVVGFGRTLVLEMLHLRLQFLDLSPDETAGGIATTSNAIAIAESVIRFEAARAWVGDSGALDGQQPLLYSTEPELYLEPETKKLYIPRFKLNKSQNDRYNSGRRTITQQVDGRETALQLVPRTDGTCYLLEDAQSPNATAHPSGVSSQTVEIDILYSMSQAIEVLKGSCLFPILGRDRMTGEKTLALSPKQASRISVPKTFVLPGVAVPEEQDVAVETLQKLYTELLAQSMVSDVPADTQLVLLQPDPALAQVVSRIATDKGAKLTCLGLTTREQASRDSESGLDWRYAHPMASKPEIHDLVHDLIFSAGSGMAAATWLIFNLGGPSAASFAQSLVGCLPQEITTQLRSEGNWKLSPGGLSPPPGVEVQGQTIRDLLIEAKYGMMVQDSTQEPGSRRMNVVSVGKRVDQEHAYRDDRPHVISWDSDQGALPVQVMPVDNHIRFRSDKTYWLVGLTGGLGLSLCEWMAQHGARHLVISSRSPKVDERWLKKMKWLNVHVEVLANDVCDRASVHAAYNKICQTMPPVAGVAQGAMVLHDTMFLDLDMERISKVMGPKVKGTMHLEEIFRETKLDFFIFFSSMAAVTGNPGQSAYAAANMFMSSLASQRRRRGLNASVVHIGAIFGNGYVTRELTLAQQEFLGKVGNLWLSEQDFRQLFAEAVLAGQASRGKNPELSTGLKMIDGSQESEDTITWFRNPMFQHCIRSEGQEADQLMGADGLRDRRGVPVKAQLQDAINPAEVHEIISEAFAAKLQSSLQIEEDRPLMDLRADTIGIDSLVAVDIRSWFIKELQVEIPVLKILSGATMGELIANAQELLPQALTPNLDPNNKDKPRQKDAPKVKAKKEPVQPEKPKAPEPQQQKKQPTQASAQESKLNGNVSAGKPRQQANAFGGPSATHTQPGNAEDRREEPIKGSSSVAPSSKSITHPDSDGSRPPSQADTLTSSFDKIAPPSVADTPAYSTSNTWSEIDDSELRSQSSNETPFTSTTKSIRETKSVASAGAQAVSDVSVTKRVPIAFAQSRFWFMEHFLQDASIASNITLCIDLEGSLDVEKFGRSVKLIGQRHEALRTRFVPVEGDDAAASKYDVMQEVLASPTLALEVRDIDNEAQADDVYKEVQGHRYKLTEGQHMRVVLLRRSAASFRLIIGYHHINMDGVSLEVILRELQVAYDSTTRLPSVQHILQYPDFAVKQRRAYESGQWNSDLAFWRKEFDGGSNPAVLEPIPLLPLAKSSWRSLLVQYSTSTAEFHIDQKLLQSIQAACGRLKVTPFHFHLAVFYTLLIRLVDVENLCIGISSANRGHEANMLQSVGLYLNLLPVLFKSQPNLTFTNVLRMVRDKSLAALSHSKVPFDVIVSELDVPRSTTHNPLFQVLVNYRPGVSERRSFCGCETKATAFEQAQTAYDLVLDVIENPGGDCRVMLAGQSALYDAEHMDMLKDMYKQLLLSFARNPALRLSMASLYDANDVKHGVELGRGSFYKHTWPETIPGRIDEMVKRYSGKTALIEAGQGSKTPSSSLTYAQMADRVNTIAVAMSNSEPPVTNGSVVGVFLQPGMEWICSLLAVLRLGAIYVPLDPRTGFSRLSVIVQDCKPAAILVNNSTEQDSKGFDSVGTRINIDQIDISNHTAVSNKAEGNSVAAILYTSGSTGVPKGIVMKHETFRNNIEIMTTESYFREGLDATLQQSSYSFDMSLSQTFVTLANGGTLHVVPKELRGDPTAISSIIATQGITFTIATPAEYISWIRDGNAADLGKSDWVLAQTGGEPVSKALANSFQEVGKASLKLVDCYGPTEITFCCGSRDVDYWTETSDKRHQDVDAANVAGLKTWPNYSVCIVDANMKPVPAGVPGEVLIGGAGVVAGYLHSELDARGFSRDSFASTEFLESGWSRLHRTGDLGKLSRVDGSLTLLGRIAGDTQVKLRGLRIDLKEVEAAIIDTAEGKIADAAVTVRESDTTGSEFLVAFVTTTASHGDANSDFSNVLHRLPLPPYMRPAAIVHLAKLPTNVSNKIDRNALKSLSIPQGGGNINENADTASLNSLLDDNESRMKQLWEDVISKEVLSKYQITPESDFFHVGGNSMLLIKLRTRIQKEFGTGEILLSQLFDTSTLGGMVGLVTSHLKAPERPAGDDGNTVVEGGGEEKIIDWEEETAVSPSLVRVPASKQQFFTQPEVVVLTGATGFLGRAILKRLVEDGVVRKIHCLAVRDPKGARERYPSLFDSQQVVIHAGDLASPRFGLASEQQLLDIFSEAHVVIHNGADVSFMKTYASLKAVNVDATKELVRLSLPHQLSFHYISTAAVTHLTGERSFEQRSVGLYPPPTSPSDLQTKVGGYLATKWASERYLDKVSDRCELPIWIHRPSSITGDGASETDLMSNLLTYSRTTGLVPDTSSWHGWVDMISVERVAMEIADQVYEDYSWPGNVKYLFESGEQEIRLSDIKGVLERENGGRSVETVMMEEWVSHAEEKGLHPLLGEYLRRVNGTPLVFPRLVREGNFF